MTFRRGRRLRLAVVLPLTGLVLAALLAGCADDGDDEGRAYGIDLGVPSTAGADEDQPADPPPTDEEEEEGDGEGGDDAPEPTIAPPEDEAPADPPEAGAGDDGAERFCETMRAEQERIVAQLEGSQEGMEGGEGDFGDALVAIVGIVQAVGELRTYFAELEAVAPDEIQPELEIVVEEYDEQLDAAEGAASDPVGAIAAGIMSGITLSGPMQTLNAYALDHCGQSI
jgi:hypothetical protein